MELPVCPQCGGNSWDEKVIGLVVRAGPPEPGDSETRFVCSAGCGYELTLVAREVE